MASPTRGDEGLSNAQDQSGLGDWRPSRDGGGGSSRGPAGGAPHRHPDRVSFADPDLSHACGYEVTVSETGTGSATLVYNADGLIIREVDTEPGAKITYSGNGNAFSCRRTTFW